MKDSRDGLLAIVSSIGDLPVLPDVAASVLRFTEDSGGSLGKLSDHIGKDPSLTAHILKISNSPLYGLTQKVATLKLALVVLGVREVKNIVLGLSVFQAFFSGPAEALAHAMWQHSLEVAGLNRKLGAVLAPGLQAEDFIAGLLHDIGKLVLFLQYKKFYSDLLAKAGADGAALCATEKSMFGFTHADAAGALVTHWNLPAALSDALAAHHGCPERPLRGAKEPRLAALTRIANRVAHEDFSAPGLPHPAITEEPEAWEILNSPQTPKTAEERETLLGEFLAEVRQSSKNFLGE